MSTIKNIRCIRKNKEYMQESNQCSQSPILDEISAVCPTPMTLRESSLSGEVIVLPIVERQRLQ